jgi:hypothetical protein
MSSGDLVSAKETLRLATGTDQRRVAKIQASHPPNSLRVNYAWCRLRIMMLLEISRGVIGNWTPIIPETLGETLYDGACGAK